MSYCRWQCRPCRRPKACRRRGAPTRLPRWSGCCLAGPRDGDVQVAPLVEVVDQRSRRGPNAPFRKRRYRYVLCLQKHRLELGEVTLRLLEAGLKVHVLYLDYRAAKAVGLNSPSPGEAASPSPLTGHWPCPAGPANYRLRALPAVPAGLLTRPLCGRAATEGQTPGPSPVSCSCRSAEADFALSSSDCACELSDLACASLLGVRQMASSRLTLTPRHQWPRLRGAARLHDSEQRPGLPSPVLLRGFCIIHGNGRIDRGNRQGHRPAPEKAFLATRCRFEWALGAISSSFCFQDVLRRFIVCGSGGGLGTPGPAFSAGTSAFLSEEAADSSRLSVSLHCEVSHPPPRLFTRPIVAADLPQLDLQLRKPVGENVFCARMTLT